MTPAEGRFVARFKLRETAAPEKPGEDFYLLEMPVISWDGDGNPLVLNEKKRALQRASAYPNFHDVAERVTRGVAGVVPGGGWRIHRGEGAPTGHIVAWGITTDGDLFAHFVDENGESDIYSPGDDGKLLPPGAPAPGRAGALSGIEEKRLDPGNS